MEIKGNDFYRVLISFGHDDVVGFYTTGARAQFLLKKISRGESDEKPLVLHSENTILYVNREFVQYCVVTPAILDDKMRDEIAEILEYQDIARLTRKYR